jgi:hypothetical protein
VSTPAESLASSRTIAAPLAATWNAKLFVANQPDANRDVEPYPALPAPRPLHIEGDHSLPGGVKNVTFNRGTMAVEVTARQEMRLLAYRFVGQNHVENRGAKLLDGRMIFEPVTSQQTRVTVETRYQPLMTPRWYWRPFEQMTGEKVHAQILNELQRASESKSAVTTPPPQP